MPVYFHLDGSATPHPTTRKHARRLQQPRYDTGNICKDCHACSIRFTYNSECIHCRRLEAIQFYNEEINGGCAPTTVEIALVLGSKVYVTEEMCRKAGHVGVRTLSGDCVGCIEARGKLSPRQQALRDGKRWYTPIEPCTSCGTTALRYVNNGRCRGCVPLKRAEEGETLTADTYMTTYLPDLVITKAAAIDKGLTIYRTGEPCDNGHKVYRDVESERCLGC